MNKCKYCGRDTKKIYCNRYCYMNSGNFSKAGNDKQRQNKTGCAYNKELQHKGGINAAKTNRNNKTGTYFNPQLRLINAKAGGKVGGLITIKLLRQRKNIFYKNCYFDSPHELEIAMCLYLQRFIKNFIEGRNVHIEIGGKEYDFLIDKYNIFIEPHHILNYYKKETLTSYIKERRDILDNNGYEDYKLEVII